MKILLIEPPYDLLSLEAGTVALFEPLGLETIAGMVPEAEVRLLDLRLDRDEERRIEGFSPDLCAFACHSYATLPSTLRTMSRIRRRFPKALLVVGGHATMTPELFNHPAVDAIVQGEGEETFLELAQTAAAGRDLAGCKGLALPNRGPDLLYTGPRIRRREIDGYPLPRRELTAAYRQDYFRFDWRPMASLITSRGCPFHCDYCSIIVANENRFRIRKPEKIVAELETIREPFVTIVDDNMLVDLRRIERLVQLLREGKIRKTYSIYARTDTIAGQPEMMRELAAVGVKRVLLGMDGFRDSDLADRNKQNSVQNNRNAIAVLHRCGMQALGYFLIRPDYTEQDFESLARHVRELDIFQPIFTMLTPLPGTPLYERVKSQLTTHDPRFYDFLHMVLPTRLPLQRFYECYAKLYRACHRRSLLKMTPTKIRAFLVLRRLYQDHLKREMPCLPPPRPQAPAPALALT